MVFAKIGLVLLLALIAFQVSAAAGIPVGKFTQGGKNATLSARQRTTAAISVGIITLAFISLATKIELFTMNPASLKIAGVACIVFAIFFTVNIIMNLFSSSPYEKIIMTPVAALLAVAFWIAALQDF